MSEQPELTAKVLAELKHRVENINLAQHPNQWDTAYETETASLMLRHAPAMIAAAEMEKAYVEVATALSGRIAELKAALKLARSHIISHHASHLNGGELGWCPVCHKEDGTEPEMDLIDSTLNGGTK